MIFDIIGTTFNFIIAIVLLLLKLILAPIDFFITQALPTLAGAFDSVGTYITLLLTNIGWVLSITGVPAVAIALVVAYWIFKLTVPIQVWTIKLAVNWYTQLKP